MKKFVPLRYSEMGFVITMIFSFSHVIYRQV